MDQPFLRLNAGHPDRRSFPGVRKSVIRKSPLECKVLLYTSIVTLYIEGQFDNHTGSGRQMIKTYRHNGLKELFETGATRRINAKFHARCIEALQVSQRCDRPAGDEQAGIPPGTS